MPRHRTPRQRWLTPPLWSLGSLAPVGLGAVAGLTGLAGLAPHAAVAATWATADEAARRAFPTATAWQERLITPAADEAAALAAPGAAPRSTPLRVIEARQGATVLGHVIVDAVIGKFELIDYAVALGADGRVVAVEVLSYRESHGAEVRLPAWRAQFNGKGPADTLRVGGDIANISGATLSCTHLTDGVRRLVGWSARLQKAGRL